MARKKLSKGELEEKKQLFSAVANKVEEVPVDQFLKDNFLINAWSTTLDRSLTDVTGLKPVQRRILYTMYLMGLNNKAGRKKVAQLGGAVLAFHPHGDSAVVEALKKMARAHEVRVPLIDGKGDFGAPGYPGASGRYIEARLSEAGWINVEELADNAVPMVPGYDDTSVEPSRLPVRWPVSIINGSESIGTGYASKIPSHNPTEIMKALKLLLRDPDATDAQILKIVKGPDFNTGGVITSNDGVKEYIKTGKGSFKVRGRYEIEVLDRRRTRIEFHEIPFDTDPEKVLTAIQKGVEIGRFKDIASIKDLKDLEHPTRIVIETRPGVQYQKVLNELFAYTPLETSYSSNITTIIESTPVQTGIRELLLGFIKYRKQVTQRKMLHLKGKRSKRLRLVKGLLLVLLDIDTAIKIIRNSDSVTEASKSLRKEFAITEEQANHILSLQLRRLTKMDSLALEKEAVDLEAELLEISEILTKESVLVDLLDKEFSATMKVIASPRKTEILSGSHQELLAAEKEELKELKSVEKDQPCFVTRFSDGRLMKTLKSFSYQKGSSYKWSPIVEEIPARTQGDILLINSDAEACKISANFLPLDKAITPSQAGANFSEDTLIGISPLKGGHGIGLATKNGIVKVSKMDFPNRDTFTVINLEERDKLIGSRWMKDQGEESLFTLITSDAMVLSFNSSLIRPSGVNAGGVIGMKLKEGAEIICFGVTTSRKDSVILSQAATSMKATSLQDIPIKGRGGMGVILQTFATKEPAKLRQAFVGVNPILTIASKKGEVPPAIGAPPITKRAGKGSSFTIPTNMGSMTA